MTFHQITSAERYTLGALRKQGYSNAEIARVTDRHRSTIGPAESSSPELLSYFDKTSNVFPSGDPDRLRRLHRSPRSFT